MDPMLEGKPVPELHAIIAEAQKAKAEKRI